MEIVVFARDLAPGIDGCSHDNKSSLKLETNVLSVVTGFF